MVSNGRVDNTVAVDGVAGAILAARHVHPRATHRRPRGLVDASPCPHQLKGAVVVDVIITAPPSARREGSANDNAPSERSNNRAVEANDAGRNGRPEGLRCGRRRGGGGSHLCICLLGAALWS